MTDRELLELAAKAAGFTHYTYENHIAEDKWGSGFRWNPLTNNGDAFKLVVRLNLAIESTRGVSVVVCADYGNNGYDVEVFELLKDADPYAATRRAIVRAAAEIGKTPQD